MQVIDIITFELGDTFTLYKRDYFVYTRSFNVTGLYLVACSKNKEEYELQTFKKLTKDGIYFRDILLIEKKPAKYNSKRAENVFKNNIE